MLPRLPGADEVLDGLRRGIRDLIDGELRVGLVYAYDGNPELVVDPQGFLKESQGILEHWEPETVRTPAASSRSGCTKIDGKGAMLGYAVQSRPREVQVYILVEGTPRLASMRPLGVWAEFACQQLLSMANSQPDRGRADAAGHAVLTYGEAAVGEVFKRELSRRSSKGHPGFDVPKATRWIRLISQTREEGRYPEGGLIFCDPTEGAPPALTLEFDPPPSVENPKHVRKLLQLVERSDRYLISDGAVLLGVTDRLSPNQIVAEFSGHETLVSLGQEPVCAFRRGTYVGFTQANEVEALRMKIEFALQSVAGTTEAGGILVELADEALREGHGCTLVVSDPSTPPGLGQRLKTPLNLAQTHDLETAKRMTKVDGALHVDHAGLLHGFGYILDGETAPTEDLARGSRYNSALRYTVKNPQAVAVAVSADALTSVFFGGDPVQMPDSVPKPVGASKVVPLKDLVQDP